MIRKLIPTRGACCNITASWRMQGLEAGGVSLRCRSRIRIGRSISLQEG
jgi:hypothetical protein